MTSVLFDRTTGRLRVDRAGLADLVTGGSADTGEDPRVRIGLDAVRTPICRLMVRVATPREAPLVHEGWLRPEGMALLLAGGEELADFITLAPEFLASVLARITRIGPRTVDGVEDDAVALVVPTAELDALWSDDAGSRRAAFDLVPGSGWAWRVDLTFEGPDGDTEGRSIVGVDGDGGLRLVDVGPAESTLVHSTAAHAWLAFTRILPTDTDLDRLERLDTTS